MLVVPISSRTNKKEISYVSILLILVNCFVFFFLQRNDNRAYFEAYNYYENSGLAATELKAYLHTFQYGDNEIATILKTPESRAQKSRAMSQDNSFQYRLYNDLIIRPEDTGYSQWREKRHKFKLLLNKVVSKKYGYSPVEKNYLGFFTCMFLHGGVMHLVGNMVFLWLVGSLLELAIGPVFFLAGYLITGVCASALFGVIYPLSPGPLVGASGAIAGLMSAYSIFFWRQKIRVFYSFGFYFNYATVPALALLPFWLANEFLQLFLNQFSRVAYVAHIGGLLSGGLLAELHLLLRGNRAEDLFTEEKQQNKLEQLLDNGKKKLAALEMEGAKNDMEEILSLVPDHPTALRALFNINKINSQSAAFHQSAGKLLSSLMNRNDDEFRQIVEEYRRLSREPQLSDKMLAKLITICLKENCLKETSNYLTALIKQAPGFPGIPSGLMRLAKAHQRDGHQQNALKCLQVLESRYGQSNEGMQARKALEKIRR